MRTMRVTAPALASLLLSTGLAQPVGAHPGRTAADGCHNDRKNGGRHCHGSASEPSSPLTLRSSGRVHYRNCAAARAAGAAPVRRGDAGYAAHLDRDNDGVGCE